MAKSSAKRKAQGGRVRTSARHAPVSYIFGILMLSFGLIGLISMIATVDSWALKYIHATFHGLSGMVDFALPIMLIWGGAALITHAYHGVSARNYLIGTCIFLTVSAMVTLYMQVNQNGFLMEYIYGQNQRLSSNRGVISNPNSILSYMNYVFQRGWDMNTNLCGGGLLSMLLAYPVFKVFGAIGSIIFVTVLCIVLVNWLFKVDVVGMIRSASDTMEKHRVNKISKAKEAPETTEEQEIDEKQQSLPNEPLRPGQRVQVHTDEYQTEENLYGQPAFNQQPYYPENPVGQPVQPDPYQNRQNSAQERFVPVSNEGMLYDEYIPVRENDSQQAPQNIQPVQNDRGQLRRTSQDYTTAQPQNIQPVQPKIPTVPQNTYPQQTRIEPAKKPEQTKQQAERTQQPAVPKTEPAQTTPQKPAETSFEKQTIDSDWLTQLRKRQEELEAKKQKSESDKPKPVYTDPVMEMKGERISIKPSVQTETKNYETKLDDTPKEKPQQLQMPLPVSYTPPSFDLLNKGQDFTSVDTSDEDEARAQAIVRTLNNFNIPSEVMETTHGPAITRFALQIAEGIKVSRINSLQDNIALAMGTDRVRIESPILGTSYVGIEIPNQKVMSVSIREVLESDQMKRNASPLLVALGKDIAGQPITCELSKMPHLLIAGATGSGKSVCINSIICSLLYRATPEQVRLIMVDPKQVELQVYNGIPHLLNPVISDPKKAAAVLNWAVAEMLDRYGKFSAMSVRNLDGYNKKIREMGETSERKPLHYIVIIIDEMADLMQVCRKDVEDSIARLAALARAAGIYMVLATQRPSVDVITGVIKNNIPSRIAFTVSSGVDSRTIIDTIGAEKLMGKGDMLYQPTGVTKPTRVQGCFVSDDEVTAITDDIKARYASRYDPNINESVETQTAAASGADTVTADDGGAEPPDSQFNDLLMEAIRMAVEDGQSSISMLQRRLRIGYARAGRLIDEMTKRGIISESEGSKPRKTLITPQQYAELLKDGE